MTSRSGAALRDVLIALRRRSPATEVLIYPTSVQGSGAADEICRTLKLADRRAECDVLVDGSVVGVVTSGNFSPMLERGIALAFVPPAVDVGADVTIDVRGREVAATVVDTPFWAP